MKTSVHLTVIAAASLAASIAGCSSAPTVFRAQEPQQDPGVQQTAFGTQPHPGEAVHDHYQYNEVLLFKNANGDPLDHSLSNHLAGLHSGSTSGHTHGGAACPPCEDCPHCKGCPPAGQSCPFCQQDVGGSHDPNSSVNPDSGLHGNYPYHRFTYSYHRPKNLSYPPPQIPGGAVVWPYYTLKGPGDFFSAE